MANLTQLRGLCPPPFFDLSKIPHIGGSEEGRFCAPVARIDPDLVCCMPCPITDWLYPDSFTTLHHAAGYVSAAGLALSVFVLISFAVLPPEKTRRHFLTVCLLIGIILFSLASVVPLAVEPEQCFDEITPNDMRSSLPCAWSGAFIIAGGLTITVWLFFRVLAMHLQICWDISPGKVFFYTSQVLGWGVIGILFTATMIFTGVSNRFGELCHVGAKHSMKDFWGPIFAFTGAAGLLQIATVAYCLKVYLENMWRDNNHTTSQSSGRPSEYASSTRTQTARVIYRRVKNVMILQWRSMLIVIFILIDVVYFAVVFQYLEKAQKDAVADPKSIEPWLICLVLSEGRKEPCLEKAKGAFVQMPVVTSVLFLLAATGIQAFLLMGRWTMFSGWIEFFKTKFTRRREFVSLDARRNSPEMRTFELHKVGTPTDLDPSNQVTSPAETYVTPSEHNSPDYFSPRGPQREYKSPPLSYSSPKPPEIRSTLEIWDPKATYARSGLGLHPPDDGDVMRTKI